MQKRGIVSPPENQTNALHPIRIGAVAVQPAPDPSDMLYIGLASLLPDNVQGVCSCAGLFFARVLSHENEVELEVAALARYFAGDDATLEHHIRKVTLSSTQFEQFLEYDHERVRYAPCDIRELLEEHETKVRSLQQRSTEVTSSLSVVVGADREFTALVREDAQGLLSHVEKEAHSLVRHGAVPMRSGVLDEDQVKYEHEAVIVPLSVIRDLVPAVNATQRISLARLDRLVLRAALQQVYSERQERRNVHEHRALKDKERRIRRVYQLREQVPTRKLIEVVPIYGRGKGGEIVSCRVDIDVPMLIAAERRRGASTNVRTGGDVS